MLYTVARSDWSAGRPLREDPAGTRFFRSRVEAEAFAEGRGTLAVAVRYDPWRGEVVHEGAVARERAGGWSARAVEGPAGALTVLGVIPGVLVRRNGRAEVRVHPGVWLRERRPHEATARPRACGVCPSAEDRP